ncbi:MAG: hypothetical protein AB7T22_07330 [Calditrichaceae bacterium]
MKENGFPVLFDDEISEKLEELDFLGKNIGKTGKLALSPIIHRSNHDHWQLSVLVDN